MNLAAAFNLTQSLRALLAGQGVRVHAVLTGPTDTDMTRGFDIPKASPGVCGPGHLRRGGQRGRGHLPRALPCRWSWPINGCRG
jgi:NAD(P)-dependent dehydrogenase (short-subunit alcohol dehydrogenase family)